MPENGNTTQRTWSKTPDCLLSHEDWAQAYMHTVFSNFISKLVIWNTGSSFLNKSAIHGC